MKLTCRTSSREQDRIKLKRGQLQLIAFHCRSLHLSMPVDGAVANGSVDGCAVTIHGQVQSGALCVCFPFLLGCTDHEFVHHHSTCDCTGSISSAADISVLWFHWYRL